jgi:hypothetical protein
LALRAQQDRLRVIKLVEVEWKDRRAEPIEERMTKMGISILNEFKTKPGWSEDLKTT